MYALLILRTILVRAYDPGWDAQARLVGGKKRENELEKTAATVIGRITVIDAWRRIITVMTKVGITNSS